MNRERIFPTDRYGNPMGPARDGIVRCRDCKHGLKGGTLCMFFAAWEPIAGGDEHAETPADVEPDGFCAWGDDGVTA